MSQQDYLNLNVPKNDDLHIYWWNDKGIRKYVVVCSCGNKKLMVVEKGLRCHNCGKFHSHQAFLKAKEKVYKAVVNDSQGGIKKEIEQLPQPFLAQWKMWKIRDNRRKLFNKQWNNLKKNTLQTKKSGIIS